MPGFLRRILGALAGREPEAERGEEHRSERLLSREELDTIGTERDPLRDYEAAAERNFHAMEAESRGDTDRAVALYEESVAARFVESHPYERLAALYERRGRYNDALRVTESFIELARGGELPRGAQRSADRKLPDFEARAERYRRERRKSAD